jgi:two-component system chemotaxis sensor kinase CheA
MTIDMSQFYQVFFEESAELLGEMERLLLELDVDAPGKDELNAIFRTAHSIKGGAGTFGFNEITETTHILESLLDKLRNDQLRLRSEMVDVFLKAVDVLKMQLAGRQSGSEVDAQAVADICKRLHELADGKQAAPAAVAPVVAPVAAVAAVKQAPRAVETAQAPAAGDPAPVDPSPENLYAILTGEELAPAAAESYGFFADTTPPAQASVGEQPARRATDAAVEMVPKTGRRAGDRGEAAEASSIRVGVEKVDQLINLVGELVITQAMLAQTASRVDPVLYESLMGGLATLERNTRDLQESVMSIRMMPISFVFSRFPRVVRDLAAKLNKQVELKTVGEGTELDKGLIEKIADPLNHLVRNSLDHGIETPDKRIAAGKDPKGTITLRAFHQGGNIIVEVADDGGGLSRAKILAKARERGLAVSDDMPDQDVWQMIFEAGFSTADVVTDVSGRGVGMDVVRRNIHGMGGSIEISSLLGSGTCISIRLPLTLAILDGMSVAVGKEIFIIPLTYIIESLQPAPGDIKTISGQGSVVQVRGEYLPVVALHEKFKLKPNVADMDKGIMVILESEGAKTALFVDELVGQHQVVIKSLETNYRKAQGISGATIMGDGKVALILDVAALVRLSKPELLKAA